MGPWRPLGHPKSPFYVKNTDFGLILGALGFIFGTFETVGGLGGTFELQKSVYSMYLVVFGHLFLPLLEFCETTGADFTFLAPQKGTIFLRFARLFVVIFYDGFREVFW